MYLMKGVTLLTFSIHNHPLPNPVNSHGSVMVLICSMGISFMAKRRTISQT